MEEQYLTANDLIRSKRNPNGILPVAKNTLWYWVQKGEFPPPIKLSPLVTVWKVSEVKRWLEERERNRLPTWSEYCRKLKKS